jgi:branched-chain amino acid transport system permease protein
VYLLVFAAGSLLVGISALLFTLGGVASPTMGLTPVLIGFIGMFLGGIGTVGGAAVGGFVLGMVTSLSGLFLSPEYASVVVFGMLFIVIIVRRRVFSAKPPVSVEAG